MGLCFHHCCCDGEPYGATIFKNVSFSVIVIIVIHSTKTMNPYIIRDDMTI